MKQLLLVGGGGHCRSCVDVIEADGRFQIAGIVDAVNPRCSSYPWLGGDEVLPAWIPKVPHVLVAVGQIKTAEFRQRLFQSLRQMSALFPRVVSPWAYVSKRSELGDGTVVMHGAVVNAFASVGENCIVNSLALIEHDAQVASHCHISTGARLNGGVRVGSGSFVGSGAVVHEEVVIGQGCVIAAGAVVRADIPDRTIYRGCP
jgi:sugar O-acyltransferase (sialic acid O-acetyltransferase NeuD family)